MSEQQAEPQVIVCPQVLDIGVAQSVCDELRSALNTRGAIVLDGAAIEHVDTACLQLFCCLFTSERLCDGQVYWQQPSQALCDAARLLGLSNHLQLARSAELS